MEAVNWWLVAGAGIVGVAGGLFLLSRSKWYRTRMYAMNVKRAFDRHNVQQRVEALQSLGQNPNPVLAKKPLRELITAYQGLIADLEKVKVPSAAADVHEMTLSMHRESLQLYQMASVGGFRQKALVDRQRKLQQMERVLKDKMETLYGPLPDPNAPPKGIGGRVAAWLARRAK